MKSRLVITDSEYAKISNSLADGDPFKDVVEFIWHTGCKRQHILLIEAKHFDGKAVKFYGDTIYLNDKAIEILERLTTKHPEGPIFQNSRGRTWTGFAIAARFKTISKRLGRRVTAHDLRRAFVAQKLGEAHSEMVVAALVNQVDARKMVDPEALKLAV